MEPRKYFIDWVRVLAFLLLIFFHCAMPFVKFGWEIKNDTQSEGLSRLIWWMHQWRIPLLFFVSGAGIHFSLRKRNVLWFAGERIRRLFIPLLFAMFFTIPMQVYFEWMQKGKINMSYPDFYPQVWDMIPYPDGALTWSHMWFVVYLFVFCMLLLPVFALFKIKWMATLKARLASFLAHPVALAAMFIPLALCFYTLYLEYPEQQSLLDDWFLFLFSLTLLLFGYLLAGSDKVWDTCEQYRKHFLGIAVACIAFLFYRYWWNFELPKERNASFYVFATLNAIHIWFIILAAMGFAKKHLNFSNAFLQKANEAVYPFYILHQTVIVAAGYYVVQWSLPIAVKLLILVIITFGIIWMLYNYLIRRTILTRLLFGMKPRNKQPDSALTEATVPV